VVEDSPCRNIWIIADLYPVGSISCGRRRGILSCEEMLFSQFAEAFHVGQLHAYAVLH